MTKYSFANQADRFSRARTELMTPHRDGEEKSFIEARIQCRQAFQDFDETQVDDESARGWIKTIRRFIAKTSGQALHGGLVECIRDMDLEEKCEFSKAVDQLASWFKGKSWAETES
ncbi:hypothetical protein [Microcoleus sp. MON2_D5]|uniref:hypothetical protein n=1 Tax=Microcoleus sp. MON2_D5 TaxID=2818833 RepID=UPI002FD07FDD